MRSQKLEVKILTIVALVALVTGCEKSGLDCAQPKNESERTQCSSHKKSTEPRGPEKLPRNPQKW